MSYIPKDAVTQAFRSNKGVLTPNQIIELDNENKFTKYGQLELIETQTMGSDVSTFSFDNLREDEFDVHFVTVSNMPTATDDRHIALRMKVAGSTDSGNNYRYAMSRVNSGSASEVRQGNDTKIFLAYNVGDAEEAASGYFYMYHAGDGSSFTAVLSNFVHQGVGVDYNFQSGMHKTKTVVNGFEFATSGGDVQAGGIISLYGIRTYK
tara:strand:+ start:1030 stop:1653 length:624 start_codon:yes stop_codon:yes gene_type:complete